MAPLGFPFADYHRRSSCAVPTRGGLAASVRIRLSVSTLSYCAPSSTFATAMANPSQRGLVAGPWWCGFATGCRLRALLATPLSPLLRARHRRNDGEFTAPQPRWRCPPIQGWPWLSPPSCWDLACSSWCSSSSVIVV